MFEIDGVLSHFVNSISLLPQCHVLQIDSIVHKGFFSRVDHLSFHGQAHVSFAQSRIHFFPVHVLLVNDCFHASCQDSIQLGQVPNRSSHQVQTVDAFFDGRGKTTEVSLFRTIVVVPVPIENITFRLLNMVALKVFQSFRLLMELPANVRVSYSKVANSVCDDLSFSQFPVWFIIEEILFDFGLICTICLSHVLKLVCLSRIFVL